MRKRCAGTRSLAVRSRISSREELAEAARQEVLSEKTIRIPQEKIEEHLAKAQAENHPDEEQVPKTEYDESAYGETEYEEACL